MNFESHIQSIPCRIEVTHFLDVPGNPHTWDSADDYYGFTEAEWDVLDRKGYKADWLARKQTDEDLERITHEIRERHEIEMEREAV